MDETERQEDGTHWNVITAISLLPLISLGGTSRAKFLSGFLPIWPDRLIPPRCYTFNALSAS